MTEKAVPTISARWVPDSPRDLFQIVLEIRRDDEADCYSGTGSTILEAVEHLAEHLRWRASVREDNRFRGILGGGG